MVWCLRLYLPIQISQIFILVTCEIPKIAIMPAVKISLTRTVFSNGTIVELFLVTDRTPGNHFFTAIVKLEPCPLGFSFDNEAGVMMPLVEMKFSALLTMKVSDVQPTHGWALSTPPI